MPLGVMALPSVAALSQTGSEALSLKNMWLLSEKRAVEEEAAGSGDSGERRNASANPANFGTCKNSKECQGRCASRRYSGSSCV